MSTQLEMAILLSGGGNDLAGDQFYMVLNHAESAEPGINESVAAGVIDQRILAAYVKILTVITSLCEKRVGQRIRIVLHGYDYPVPDGRGFGPFGIKFLGPWLEPGFRVKGYGDGRRQERIDMMKVLIDRLNRVVSGVARLPGFEHVRFADLRGTLSTGPKYKKWWANELHPTEAGFEAVSKKFVQVIEGP